MRPVVYTASLAVLLLAAAGLTATAKKVSGDLHGTTTATPTVGNEVQLHVSVEGNLPHVGRCSAVLDGAAKVGPGDTFTAIPPTTGVVTVPNGDEIYFVLNWSSAAVGPGLQRISGPFQLTGGVGRFKGATGDGLYEALINTATGETHSHVSGTLRN